MDGTSPLVPLGNIDVEQTLQQGHWLDKEYIPSALLKPLSADRCSNFKSVKSKNMLLIVFMSNSCEISLN